MKYDVLGAFAVPFIKFSFTKHEQYEFENIPRSVNLPPGWVVPLNSSFPNIKDNDPIVRADVRDALKQDLYIDIKDVLMDLNIRNDFEIPVFWYNVYHSQQGQEPHNHLSSCEKKNPIWSGIYYNKNATPTHFIRNDQITCRTQEFPGWMNTKLSSHFAPVYMPEVSDGDIILFPPYLQHAVRYERPTMRMTFAFNLYLK